MRLIIPLLLICAKLHSQYEFSLCNNSKLNLNAQVNAGEFYWIFNNEFVGYDYQQISIDTTGTFIIECIAINQTGCEVARKAIVIIKSCDVLYIPNAFTPDGDGLNDEFGPVGSIKEYQLEIYNQWGELVYSSGLPWKGNGVSDVYAFKLTWKSDGISNQKFGRVKLVQ